MKILKQEYTVKLTSFGYPKICLGMDVGKAFHPDRSYIWVVSSDTYVKEVL